MTAPDAIARWAAANGIEARVPHDPSTDGVPRTDYGKLVTRTPAVVLAPRDEAEVASCFRFLSSEDVPFVLRGTGHSSGGQTVTDGVLVDLRAVSGIVRDEPDRERITVRGGTSWLALCEHLEPQRRRPVALTDNARMTIAGTLSVGGFGDTSHRHGMQIASVERLVVITPDGERHDAGPNDDLFRFALAGRGQLGAITEITLRTLRATFATAVRRFEYRTIDEYVRDALVATSLGLYEFMRARVFWNSPNAVHAIWGNFTDEMPAADPGIGLLRPREWSPFAQGNLLEQLRLDASPRWTSACPAVELALPLPAGLGAWNSINDHLHRHGVLAHLQHGASIAIVPRHDLPLAPVPDADYSLLIALRPIMPPDTIDRWVPIMRDVATMAIDAGARLYLMSVEPDRGRVLRQFGSAAAVWEGIKRRVDPRGLCNRGLIVAS